MFSTSILVTIIEHQILGVCALLFPFETTFYCFLVTATADRQ